MKLLTLYDHLVALKHKTLSLAFGHFLLLQANNSWLVIRPKADFFAHFCGDGGLGFNPTTQLTSYSMTCPYINIRNSKLLNIKEDVCWL